MRLISLFLTALLGMNAVAQTPRKILFISHSAGFVHPVVKRPSPGALALAETRLKELSAKKFDVQLAQDAATITADSLRGFDAVIFMTTGEIPLPEPVRDSLFTWLKSGGALVGIHCATDTYYKVSKWADMIGGVFAGHPWTQEVGIRVEQPKHPSAEHLGSAFRLEEEIYQFKDWYREPLDVVLSLDTLSVDATKGQRKDGDYALAWGRAWGEGRVFYTALGHGPSAWNDPRFLRHLEGGIDWALSKADNLRTSRPPGSIELIGDGVIPNGRMRHRNGSPSKWMAQQGGLEVAPGTGSLVADAPHRDASLHVEFMIPEILSDAMGQARGNSGVFLSDCYEIQILDGFGLPPIADGCGSIYGKQAPAENAALKPLRWQTFDIRFTAPVFDATGKKTSNARATVWHNGIPIHRDVEIDTPTSAGLVESPTGGALRLQDHGSAVRFRRVWMTTR